MSKLIIAEKNSVAKAIAPVVGANTRKDGYYEGNGYIVSWCVGHLVSSYKPDDYSEKWSNNWSFEQLPMIPEMWKFKVNVPDQYKVVKNLLNENSVTEVICATDADREGECIFRYTYKLSGCNKPVKRLWVSSLEETAIKDALAKMKDWSAFDNLYHAGFSRTKADWLIGMNATRLFSVRYNTTLKIGRVKTPTLAMIVKRDYEVENFITQKYFTIDLNCGSFVAESERIDDEHKADEILPRVTGKTASVTEVKKEIKTMNPPKLYDLTTLQREANKYFGYTAEQTLKALQTLYEAKLATYPRTDSQYLTDDMEDTAVNVTKIVYEKFPTFGNIVDINIKRCINNSKVTGHHAILPTEKIKDADLSELPEEQKNILLLISSKLVLATAAPHKYEAVKVTVICENTDFKATGKTVLENGWKSLEEKMKALLKSKETDDEKAEKKLPDLTQGQQFENVTAEKTEHWTSPPKPYTEDTLLSAMEHAGQEEFDDDVEKKGLGTPATRAAIIEEIIQNGCAVRKGKQILSTDIGKQLIKVVPDNIKSPLMTAEWENQLLQIERGNLSESVFMDTIKNHVIELCQTYGQNDDSVSFRKEAESLGKCPKCGNDVKNGKYGFYCTGKCGMNLAKVYGKELTETQLQKLLNGKQISYTANGKKTIVLPEVVQNDYNGKTYFQWKTEKG